MRFCLEEQLPESPEGPVVYCDGAGSATFRPGIDLELSHWIPNRTPKRFAADTSSEICLEFVASDAAPGPYQLVVNNHVDVDGILSVFTILEPELALRHRDVIVQAAEMGDFWGWGERPAQRLCQALARNLELLLETATDADAIYRSGFEITRSLLGAIEDSDTHSGTRSKADSERDLGVDWLAHCVLRIERGEIRRTGYHERFVHYELPEPRTAAELEASLRIMPFNVPLCDRFALLPHARARFDRERIALQSVECSHGRYYDLHYPGYAWAETPNSWQPPGLVQRESSNLHQLHWPPLERAAASLNADEKAEGRWLVSETLSPFSTLEGRGFPVVLSFMHAGQPAASQTPPSAVAACLAAAFEGS